MSTSTPSARPTTAATVPTGASGPPPTAADLRLRELAGGRLFVALWGSLAVIALAHRLGAPDAVAVALVGAVVLVSSLGEGYAVGLLLAGIAWLCVLGFVVDGGGALTRPDASDLGLLAALAATAVVGRAGRRGLDAILTPGRRVGAAPRRTVPEPRRESSLAPTRPGDR